ncbi:MAG: IS3 family transposase, partial [Thermoleophilaceae bacterium]
APARSLSATERRAVLAELRSERFVDASPAQVWATLIDEGRYLASERTMYRLLAANGEVRERRDQLTHPPYERPELLAERPNEVWSWDISKLKGPAKWTYYYLYVILDVFSRYAVGWTVAERESAAVAEALIAQAAEQQSIEPGQLTVHADRGSSMRSKPVAMLLADLGVTKTHSRPYTSTDNPYSEAQFKTLKYRPGFPARFDSIEQARAFCRTFFGYYNHEHRHSGIGLMSPATVHQGRAEEAHAARRRVLEAAYAAAPERFVRGAPKPPTLPGAAWINKPDDEEVAH